MSENIEIAKQKMEEGWKAREGLEFEKAEQLLTEAKAVFEQEQDWFNVTEALNHLAYTYKLRAIQDIVKAANLAKESKAVADKYNVKMGSVLRALVSTTSTEGSFEQALKYGNMALEFINKPAPRADMLSHIALFYLRTGNIVKAEETIIEAEKLSEEGYADEREPHRSIWQTKLLGIKALIEYNKGNKDLAKGYVEDGLKIAQEKSLKTRTTELTELMKIF